MTYAIRLGVTTGKAKMGVAAAGIVSATGLTFRVLIKGDKLQGSASAITHVCGVEDAAGSAVKMTFVLDRDGAGIVTPKIHHSVDGYITVGGTYLSSAPDTSAWYEILASLHNGAATWSRRCLIWNVSAQTVFYTHESNVAVSNLAITAGLGCFTVNKSDFFWTTTQGDVDWAAVYNNTPYDSHDESTGPPATPTGSDTGILGCWLAEENTGTSLANAVGGGTALTCTSSSWVAGFTGGSVSLDEILVAPFCDVRLAIGQTTQLVIEGLDASRSVPYGITYSYGSGDSGIASVNGSGLVTAVAVGTTNITVSSSGKSTIRSFDIIADDGLPIISRVTTATWYNLLDGAVSSGTVRSCSTAGQLTTALTDCVPGDIIELAAGTSFVGNFVIPAKTGNSSRAWITIRTAGTLPPNGQRATAAIASTYNYAKIYTNNGSPPITHLDDTEVMRVLIDGVEIGIDPASVTLCNWAMLEFGSANTLPLRKFPKYIIVRRCYIHGKASTFIARAGMSQNGAWIAAIDCDFREFHYSGGGAYPADANYDSQAIRAFQGSGPLYARNCYLESAHEPFAMGGTDPTLANVVISDVLHEYCYYGRPVAWRSVYTCKNCFEVKQGIRVECRYFIMENSWVDNQAGYATVLWSVNQGGAGTWMQTRDIYLHHGWCKTVAGLANLTDSNGATVAAKLHRVRLEHILITGLDSANTRQPGTGTRNGRGVLIAAWGDAFPAPDDISIRHCTWFGLAGAGAMIQPFNNSVGETIDYWLVDSNVFGNHDTGLWNSDGAGTTCWTAIKGANSLWRKNVMVLASGVVHPNSGSDIGNTYLTSIPVDTSLLTTPAKATDPTAVIADFLIPSGSAYKNTAYDGIDPGVDTVTLAAVTTNVTTGAAPTSTGLSSIRRRRSKG